VEHAAAWLNGRTSPNDLVIANVNLAWLLKARTADFLQAFGRPNVEKLVEKISGEKWPVVWSGKYYLILGNPKFLR
jgi:hypothetical protein